MSAADVVALQEVHSHLGETRLLQALGPPAPGPFVLLGDVNEWNPFAAPLRALRRCFGRAPAPATFPSVWPLLALDRVFAAPAAALEGVTAHRSARARAASE
ncbi:MAG TPA: endonuclease, partial [Vicinamibacteria bacterium]|nr:endonuclease [Vicinamibacteria bacterium]